MIKFVVFEIYTSDMDTPYSRAAIAIDKVTSLVAGNAGDDMAFTYIYLTENGADERANYVRVKSTLEQTMLAIMAADVEHDMVATEKWAPMDYEYPAPPTTGELQ